jgi:transposase-like protein
MDISYGQLYRMNQEEARRQIVTTYLAARNISQVARLWQTLRNVVRKWMRRFEDEGGITISPHALLFNSSRYQGYSGQGDIGY